MILRLLIGWNPMINQSTTVERFNIVKTATQFQNIKRLTGSQAFFRDFLSPKPKIFLGLGPRHLIGRSIFFWLRVFWRELIKIICIFGGNYLRVGSGAPTKDPTWTLASGSRAPPEGARLPRASVHVGSFVGAPEPAPKIELVIITL